MTHITPQFDAIAERLLDALPVFAPEEQRLALALYQALARGAPVRPDALGKALALPTRDVLSLLARPQLAALTFTNRRDEIVGFGGLAVTGDMAHRLQVGDQSLFAWCAWDTMFLPGILGRTLRVESRPPAGDELVRLTIAPEGVQRVDPDSAVLSFILPTAAAFAGDVLQAMGAFCHYVYFFPTRARAETWTAGHPETFILSLDDGFRLAQLLNRSRWGIPTAATPEAARPAGA